MRTILCLLAFLAGCATDPPVIESADAVVDLSNRVVFQALETASERTLITLPAEVVSDPQSRLNLSPPAQGRLTAVHVRAGQAISIGDPIAQLDAPDLEADRILLPKLEERIQQAKAALATANRRRELGLGSNLEIQAAGANLTEVEASITGPRDRLERAKRQGLESDANGLWLWRSAYAGVIAESELQVGMTVSLEEHLLAMVGTQVAELRVALPEAYLPQINASITAKFQPRGEAAEPARLPLSRRSAAVNPKMRTLDLYFAMPALSYPSGRTGRADLTLTTESGLFRVPERAITQIDGQPNLFRARGDDPKTAEPVPVQIAGRDGSHLLIQAPSLSESDRIAVRGVFLLKSIALLTSES